MRISPISLNAMRNNNKAILKRENNSQKTSFGAQEPTLIPLGAPQQGTLVVKGKNLNNLFNIENNPNLSTQKCGPNTILTPKMQGYENLRILLSEGSKISTSEEILISKPKNPNKALAFGRLYGSIRLNNEGHPDKKMEAEYTKFFDLGMKEIAETSYLRSNAANIKDEYNHYIPTDGDGTRFKPVALLQGDVTKPASFIPAKLNNQPMSIVQAVLTNFARTGTMDDEVNFINVPGGKGSAYAFLEGLGNGQISTDKPIVFSWGDNFSDIDIARLILKHEDKNSGFTMLTIPRDKKDVSKLGVVKLKEDETVSGSYQDREIEQFVEKPQDEEFINSIVVPELSEGSNEKALAVVGPYIISREALEWIRDEYQKEPQKFYDQGKGYDFSSKIITGLLDAMKNGEIKDKKTGKPLTMNFDVLDKKETWSDVGAREDFVKAMQGIKNGEYENFPQEMKDSIEENVDKNGNIYMTENSKKIAEAFAKKNNIELKNCIVYYAG